MIVPTYSILPVNIMKNHVLEVVPHFLVLIHPDWLINTMNLANSHMIGMEIIQTNTHFKQVCTALVILNIKGNLEMTK